MTVELTALHFGGEALFDPLSVGIAERDEVCSEQQRRLVNLLSAGGGVFMNEEAA